MEYIELHCHSNFSFLDGASHPEELVEVASQLGYKALALTDHNGLYGIVRFNQVTQRKGLLPIFGSEITLEGGQHLLLLIRDEIGYANLSQLITAGQLLHEKGEAQISWDQLCKYHEGLIALSGCSKGTVPALLQHGLERLAADVACRYRELFGAENYYLELQHHHLPRQEQLCDRLYALGRKLGIPCVATNNVHYATCAGQSLQDVLVCIKNRTSLDEATGLLYPNGERCLKAPAEMAQLFRCYPDAIANTQAIAGRCRFVLNGLPTSLPSFAVPDKHTPFSYLRELTYCGAKERWGEINEIQKRQLEHELALINKLDLSGYFLIVWDIARFCRDNKILSQGRGSAANSAVCYCLGITAVDPVKLKLLFERFLSEERREPPDIDIDIANNRREEVIQYVYNKYGRAHAAMVCEVICYRGRSAVRDVGKALGFSQEEVNRLSKLLHHYSHADEMDEIVREAKLNANSERVGLLLKLSQQIQDFPRHLGIHSGGMIITKRPLSQIVPIENATMPDRSVIQWDKDDAADVGIVKIDLLGLGMLSLIDIAFQLIEKSRGLKIDPAKLGYDDPRVYDLLCAAETVGVFQVESRAQMNTLPRLQPRCFYDLVVEVALIRPGPIQGEMVHPYLRRRAGEEEVTYPHPALKPILERTLGVPLFQEQGMQVAIAAAGFSPSKADELRRAMGHKRSHERMEAIALDLIAGMTRHGIDQEIAMRIYKQLTAFADYGFPESHAASFALLVYVSAYLKVYFAPEFYCSLLNAQPMGFYSPASIVYEGQRRGVTFLPVDVNRSKWDCELEVVGSAGQEPGAPDNAPALEAWMSDGHETTHPVSCPTDVGHEPPLLRGELIAPVARGSTKVEPTQIVGQALSGLDELSRSESPVQEQRVPRSILPGGADGCAQGRAPHGRDLRQTAPIRRNDRVGEHNATHPVSDPAKAGLEPPLLRGELIPASGHNPVLANARPGSRPDATQGAARGLTKVDCTRNPPQAVGHQDRAKLVTPAMDHNPVKIDSTTFAVRLGYRYVKSLGSEAQEAIERELAAGPFISVDDFVYRTRLNRGSLQQLAMVGAFDCFALSRREAMWKIMALTGKSSGELRLQTSERGALLLPVMRPSEELIADFKGMDLSTAPHLMRHVRVQLQEQGMITSGDLDSTPENTRVDIAGVVVIRQMPMTAKGFLFITLEDEAGFINVVVKPNIVKKFGRIVKDGKALVVNGVVEKKDGVINVIGKDFRLLEFAFQDVQIRSRNFH